MTLRNRPLSLLSAGALLAALLALVSCGPGTGGTGTGREPAEFYLRLAGASAAAVCSETWAASRLACAAPLPVAATSVGHPGTALSNFASVGQVGAATFTAVFDGNTVQLQGGCPRQNFSGDWGLNAGTGNGAFFGAYESARQPAAEPARLLVRAAADGQNLQLELRALDGSLLLGPLLLQHSAGPAAPPAC